MAFGVSDSRSTQLIVPTRPLASTTLATAAPTHPRARQPPAVTRPQGVITTCPASMQAHRRAVRRRAAPTQSEASTTPATVMRRRRGAVSQTAIASPQGCTTCLAHKLAQALLLNALLGAARGVLTGSTTPARPLQARADVPQVRLDYTFREGAAELQTVCGGCGEGLKKGRRVVFGLYGFRRF